MSTTEDFKVKIASEYFWFTWGHCALHLGKGLGICISTVDQKAKGVVHNVLYF